jgi:paired amphipathic helix protein Sin3a
MAPNSVVSTPDKDMAMLDRIRKHINNKSHFTEFIKLLNLYNQDLITAQYVIYRSQAWLGQEEYISWLRKLFGVEGVPEDTIENKASKKRRRISLNHCRSYGPSYRLLPKLEHSSVCSGRDELCRSVLNDEWASHPTMSSEEGGFVAHKKTAFEESLHRIEEERHDYDSNIECLVRTIQLLDPVVRHIKSQPEANRPDYKPDPKLGGQSETIHKRTIYKLYGREQGNKVIEQLMKKCYIVAPTLLARCKDQLEKWKAGQRQWNEVWRQQTLTAYHKSLDPQGSSNQRNNAEKRQFTAKTLIQEIKTKAEAQKRPGAASTVRTDDDDVFRVDSAQYVYRYKKESVLNDTRELVIKQVSRIDDETSSDYIRDLFAAFFVDDGEGFEIANDMQISETSEASDSAANGVKNGKKARSDRLRKTALENTSGRNGTPASGSRESTPAVPAVQEEGPSEAELADDQGPVDVLDKEWINLREVADQNLSTEQALYKGHKFICNSTLYCFFRLFGVLYERLEALHSYEKDVEKLVKIQLADKPAKELGINDKSPIEFFPNVESRDKQANKDTFFYDSVVKKINEYIDDSKSASQADIEDLLRRFYMPCGWRLYHFDKLLGTLEKLAGQIMNDEEGSKKLVELFKKTYKKSTTTGETRYRAHALKYIQDADKEGDPEAFRVTIVRYLGPPLAAEETQ